MSFSFKTWPFPSSKKTSHILLCSKYGLIAHASNNNLSIYAEEYGHSTPLLMWSPFEHNITALAWYDASKTIYNTVPVLVLASESGKFEVFDCRSRRSIFVSQINSNNQPANEAVLSLQYPSPQTIHINIANSRRESDYITSIKWSQFSPSCFFVGTKNGRLIRFEIIIGQIVSCKVVWELFFDFQIDHICIEPQFGEICAVGSHKGSVATIDNINKYKEGKAPEASPYVVTLTNKTDFIHEIKFYPASTEFLILVTTSNSLLYSISENCTAPLLSISGIRKFYNIHDANNIALVVRDNSVELWQFLNNQSKRLSEAKMTTLTKLGTEREILVSDMMGDHLIMITCQMWLTTIEVKKSSKLFVTRRVKLLDSKPMSFSYANESIAIATSIGHVLVTETSNPNFVAQMTYKLPQSGAPNQTTDSQNPPNNDNNPSLPQKQNIEDTKEQNAKEEDEVSVKPKQSKQVTFGGETHPQPNNDNNQKENSSRIPSFLLSINKHDQTIPLTESTSAPNLKLGESDESSSSQNIFQSIRKNKRMRRSIFNSCASSSSLLLEKFNENIPQNEEILDKSIVMSNTNTNVNTSTVAPLATTTTEYQDNQTSIISRPFQSPSGSGINANLSRRRRVSSITTDALKRGTILSRVMNEGMKNMSKEITAIPIPQTTSAPRPITPIPPIPKMNQPQQNTTEMPKFTPSSESVPKLSSPATTQQVPTKVISKYKFGNNCSIMWNYQIVQNVKIEHIEWIASTRVITYTLSKRVTDKEIIDKTAKEEHDHDSTNDTCQNNPNLLPRYSGASFIYLIDFKYHRITRLFDKPGINISNITFSANRQYFFVTVNGFMVVLFHNKAIPKKIHSFQFESNVYVAFIAYYLIFIDSNGNIYRNRFELGNEFTHKMTKSQIKLKKEYGKITCIIGKKSSIFMGTTTGFLLNVDINTLTFKEVIQMKGSIVSIRHGPLDSALIEDSKGNMITLTSDGENFTLPVGIKTAILATPLTLLIRKKKRSFLEVYQTFGQYVPSYPKAAIRCPMMMPPHRWFRSLMNEDPIDQTVLFNYGLSYLADLVKAKQSPQYTYDQILHLRNLIMDTPQLWKTAYRLSLLLRDFGVARAIIVLNSVPGGNDQEWAINLMKCSSFIDDNNLKDPRIDGILFTGTNLIKNDFIQDGVDILVTAGLWVDAVKMLIKFGMHHDASKIARIYGDSNTIDVINDVTKVMFKNQNMIAYALTMLCEKGLEKQAIKELDNLRQYDAVKVLTKVMSEIQ